MDTRTGDLYPSIPDALKAGVPERDLVELRGSREAVESVSAAVREARAAETLRRHRKRQNRRR